MSECDGHRRPADLVAAGRGPAVLARVDRHQRHQRRRRQLVLGGEVAAQRAADDGQEQIVDGRALDPLAGRLHPVERQRDRLDHAVRRHRTIEARRRRPDEARPIGARVRGAAVAPRTGAPPPEHELRDPAERRHRQPGQPRGAADAVHRRPCVHLERRRVALGVERGRARVRRFGGRRQRMHGAQQRHARLAVDRRVVELHEQGEAAARAGRRCGRCLRSRRSPTAAGCGPAAASAGARPGSSAGASRRAPAARCGGCGTRGRGPDRRSSRAGRCRAGAVTSRRRNSSLVSRRPRKYPSRSLKRTLPPGAVDGS